MLWWVRTIQGAAIVAGWWSMLGDADVCARAGERTGLLRTNVAAGWFYTYDRKQVHLVCNSEEFPRDRGGAEGGAGFAGDEAEDVTARSWPRGC